MQILMLLILVSLTRMTISKVGTKWGEWSAWSCDMSKCNVHRFRICLTPSIRHGEKMCGDTPTITVYQYKTFGNCNTNATCPYDCSGSEWIALCLDCVDECNKCARLTGMCDDCARNTTWSKSIPSCNDLLHPDWIVVCVTPVMLLLYFCYKKLEVLTDEQDAILEAGPFMEHQ